MPVGRKATSSHCSWQLQKVVVILFTMLEWVVVQYCPPSIWSPTLSHSAFLPPFPSHYLNKDSSAYKPGCGGVWNGKKKLSKSCAMQAYGERKGYARQVAQSCRPFPQKTKAAESHHWCQPRLHSKTEAILAYLARLPQEIKTKNKAFVRLTSEFNKDKIMA